MSGFSGAREHVHGKELVPHQSIHTYTVVTVHRQAWITHNVELLGQTRAKVRAPPSCAALTLPQLNLRTLQPGSLHSFPQAHTCSPNSCPQARVCVLTLAPYSCAASNAFASFSWRAHLAIPPQGVTQHRREAGLPEGHVCLFSCQRGDCLLQEG